MALFSPARFFESRLNVNNNQNGTARPRLQTKKIRKGIVIDVNEYYGRVLCSRSFSDVGAFVFFTPETQINGAPSHNFFQSLPATVPVGTEVEFTLTYDFPSKWRSFGTYMGYFCQAIYFDVSRRPYLPEEQLLVKEHRHNGYAVATNLANASFIIHPQIWPSPSVLRKLYGGKEVEPKLNHRYQFLTQPSRTLRALVLPTPSFLKSKLRHMDHIVVAAQPLSTSVILFAVVVGHGNNELYFDSVGIRNDTRDNQPVPIVMDKLLFFSSIGILKAKVSKIDVYRMIGQVFQLGCVKNIPNGSYPLRGYCAYQLVNGPRNPTVQLPREYPPAARKHKTSVRIKTVARPLPPPPQTPCRQQQRMDEELPVDLMNTSFARKDSMKLNTSFGRRSINRKYTFRKSFQVNPRKRGYAPCSPFTGFTAQKHHFDDSDLNAKKKNLESSFRNITLSDGER